MSKKDKLIKRLKSLSKDFTFDEAKTLLEYLGYELGNKGKTSGSHVIFKNTSLNSHIILHKPHPRNELLNYQLKELLTIFEEEGLI